MSRIFGAIIKILRVSYLKFLLVVLWSLVFAVLIFPYNDLSDLVSSTVAQMTNNQIFVQFDELSLGLIPKPGLQMHKFSVDTPNFQGIYADEVTASPALKALIYQKPYFSAAAKGIFKGQLDIGMGPGQKSESGVERDHLEIKGSEINLGELNRKMNLPLPIMGNLELELSGQIDMAFREQPDLEATLNIENFELPSSNIQTPMGPLTLPDIKLSILQLKGRLSSGRFDFQEIKIGKEGNDIHGVIKGNIAVSINPAIPQMPLSFNEYSLDIDLQLTQKFFEKSSLFFNLVDQYKSTVKDGYRFAFRVSGTHFGAPPTIGPAR